MDNPADPGVDPASRGTIESPPSTGPVFDWTRAVGPFLAIGAVIGTLAICSLFIRYGGVKVSLGLDPVDPLMTNGSQEEAGGKLAALIRQGWGARGPSSPGLGVLIGASSTRYGFNSAILDAESPGPMRWINLSVEGSNAADVSRVARTILQSGVKPDVIVMGLHQEMLPRSVNFLEDEIGYPLEELKLDVMNADLMSTFDDLATLGVSVTNRAFPGRRYLTYLSREVAIEAKIAAFRRIGVGASSLFTPDPAPWTPPKLHRAPWATTTNLTEIPPNLTVAMNEKGWLLPDHYRIEDPNPRAVLNLIEECDREKVRLIIVVTPQLTLIRNLLPPASVECLDKVLEGPPGHRPEVLDLRRSIPETHFRDVLHVDEQGRDEASRLLIGYLKDHPKRTEAK